MWFFSSTNASRSALEPNPAIRFDATGRNVPGVGPRNCEETFDQASQAVGFLEHAADNVDVIRGRTLLLECQRLADRADAVLRRRERERSIRFRNAIEKIFVEAADAGSFQWLASWRPHPVARRCVRSESARSSRLVAEPPAQGGSADDGSLEHLEIALGHIEDQLIASADTPAGMRQREQ